MKQVFFAERDNVMKKDIGVQPAMYPMPVLMVATYDENGVVDVTNAAWGMICGMDKIALCLSENHKTVKNIRALNAFTVSFATKDTLTASDFFGMASGNTMTDKFDRSGFTAEKSSRVNAPIVQEYPLTLECELAEFVETEHLHAVIGKIVNVVADEAILNDEDKVDVQKLDALSFDPFAAGYVSTGKTVGKAWGSGKELM